MVGDWRYQQDRNKQTHSIDLGGCEDRVQQKKKKKKMNYFMGRIVSVHKVRLCP